MPRFEAARGAFETVTPLLEAGGRFARSDSDHVGAPRADGPCAPALRSGGNETERDSTPTDWPTIPNWYAVGLWCTPRGRAHLPGSRGPVR